MFKIIFALSIILFSFYPESSCAWFFQSDVRNEYSSLFGKNNSCFSVGLNDTENGGIDYIECEGEIRYSIRAFGAFMPGCDKYVYINGQKVKARKFDVNNVGGNLSPAAKAYISRILKAEKPLTISNEYREFTLNTKGFNKKLIEMREKASRQAL